MTLECVIADYIVLSTSGPSAQDLSDFADSVPEELREPFIDWLMVLAAGAEWVDRTLN